VIEEQSPNDRERRRRSLWEYYDRRVTGHPPGLTNARAYWTGLGLSVEVEDIAAEAVRLERALRGMSAVSFVEVGAGPGTFTGYLGGRGIAIDQSRRALDVLRTVAPEVPVIQADAFALPLPTSAVRRFFSSHLYGLLVPSERQPFLAEAHRVASEVVILDAGRPLGVHAEEWQERSLPDGGRYRVFRRHFDADTLAAEVGGEVLFDGQFYVLVSTGAVP
jgi:SAM-dependent methyltransferase